MGCITPLHANRWENGFVCKWVISTNRLADRSSRLKMGDGYLRPGTESCWRRSLNIVAYHADTEPFSHTLNAEFVVGAVEASLGRKS